jgi:hypothetical protein
VGTDTTSPPASPEIRPLDRPDNELASYRAVSGSAITSLVLGLASALSFASFYFWIAAAMAVAFGFLALRAIARQPEALTGAKLARAGIVLGLIFGLSSATWNWVDTLMVHRRAQNFVVSSLLPRLREHDLNSALYYKQQPESRRGKTPEDIRGQIERQGGTGTIMFEMQAGSIVKLNKQLEAEKGSDLEFLKIEKSTVEGTTPVAMALIRVIWPPETAHDLDPEAEKAHEALFKERGDYLGVVLRNRREGRRDSWWVDDYRYPYTPDSFVPKIQPVDDGHGHAH